MQKFLILLVAILLLFSAASAQEVKPVQGTKKKDKTSRLERKALKSEKRAANYKKMSVKALSGKKPDHAKAAKYSTKAEKSTTKAKKYRYRERSKKHIKVQEKHTKKRMKKNLRQHRKHKKNRRSLF